MKTKEHLSIGDIIVFDSDFPDHKKCYAIIIKVDGIDDSIIYDYYRFAGKERNFRSIISCFGSDSQFAKNLKILTKIII